MKKIPLIYSVTNLIGLLFFFCFFVSAANFAKIEQRDYYDFGDSLNFILIGLPVLLVCFLVNTCWGIKALIDVFRRRDYRASVAFAVVAAAWAMLYLVAIFMSKLPPDK